MPSGGTSWSGGHGHWIAAPDMFLIRYKNINRASGEVNCGGDDDVPAHDRLHVTMLEKYMVASRRAKPSRDKVRAHRDRLRRQGLRPLQIWVPDVRSPAFEAEAHRQSLAVARSSHAKDDQEFIEAVSDRDGE